jgi:hypothetical protein
MTIIENYIVTIRKHLFIAMDTYEVEGDDLEAVPNRRTDIVRILYLTRYTSCQLIISTQSLSPTSKK